MTTTVSISTPDGDCEAYLATPDGQIRGGVLFFIDAFGLRPWIGEMVSEIASWGYVVLAPNAFYRDGTIAETTPAVDLSDARERARFFTDLGGSARIARLTPDLVARDNPAYLAALQEYAGTAAPLASTGYCMGARLAMRVGGQFPDQIRAVAGFHGGSLVTADPASPHTTIDARVRYLFGHADADPSMTPDDAAALDAALTAAGATYTSAIYPDAPHGYTMQDTSNWHEVSYRRHLAELRDLFAQTLV